MSNQISLVGLMWIAVWPSSIYYSIKLLCLSQPTFLTQTQGSQGAWMQESVHHFLIMGAVPGASLMSVCVYLCVCLCIRTSLCVRKKLNWFFHLLNFRRHPPRFPFNFHFIGDSTCPLFKLVVTKPNLLQRASSHITGRSQSLLL